MVLVQVNTSGKTSKSGVDPSDCVALAKHVKLDYPNLEFCGLMTIGMPDYTSTPENFKTLLNCRTAVCKALEIPEEHCELSMGMSGDFELASFSSNRLYIKQRGEVYQSGERISKEEDCLIYVTSFPGSLWHSSLVRTCRRRFIYRRKGKGLKTRS
ncbi:hypothetical protein Droror1_Dr00004281 [Drosera rotundifolia]